jgi:hypothetical protein
MEGNLIKGNFPSKTAKKLIKEWAKLHSKELNENWKNAVDKLQLNKIEPLE